MKSVFLTAFFLITFAVITHVQGDYNKLQYKVLSSPAVDIQNVDLTPMPIYNPGEAFLTFVANLKRPIRK